MRTAAALIIGNELLTGKIADKNLVVLARTLRSLGIKFRRAVTILDELDVIAHEVRSMAAEHDWLFTSGGVGPTHDDLTIAAVAKAFDVDITVSAPMEQMRHIFHRLADVCAVAHRLAIEQFSDNAQCVAQPLLRRDHGFDPV